MEQDVFLNHHTNYIANNVYRSFEAARAGCGYDDKIETVKYIKAPEEVQKETEEV